ncbi:MAG: DegQ family serine endoprotease [Cyclonatronaceae bacterium]
MNQFSVKFMAALFFAAIIYLINFNFGIINTGEPEQAQVHTSTVVQQDVPKAADRPIRTLRDFNNAFVELAEATSPAVVTVFTSQTIRQSTQRSLFDEFFGFDPFSGPGQPQQPQEREFRRSGQGSGFIVSADGYILTNNHVVQNADSVYVRTQNNREFTAQIVGTDPGTDIAVLKVEARNMPMLKLGNSDELRIGEWVMAVGSPLSESLAHTVTQGIVSAKGRANIQLIDLEDFIQTDAAINPGNSGGPLLNLDGEVVGINTAIASRSGGFQGIGFAIPSNIAQRVMQSIIETGKVVRAYLGITGSNLDQTMAQGFGLESAMGALVYEVREGSPADKAGLKDGDIILEMNGQKVQSFDQMRANIATKVPGTAVKMKVNRNGNIINLDVTLAEMPEDILAGADQTTQESRLGFTVKDFSGDDAGRYNLNPGLNGVLVTAVDPDSEAYARGLREGDLIIAVNRRAVRSVQEFNQQAGSIAAGEVALLQAVRQNSRMFISFRVRE